MDLFKLPGVAETIDWADALMQLDVLELTPEAINDTLGVLLKYQDDIARIQGSEAAKLLAQVKAEIAAAPREVVTLANAKDPHHGCAKDAMAPRPLQCLRALCVSIASSALNESSVGIPRPTAGSSPI